MIFINTKTYAEVETEISIYRNSVLTFNILAFFATALLIVVIFQYELFT